MHIKTISLHLFALLLLILLLSSCVSIPDVKICTVAGVLSAGADCATTNSGKTSELSASEFFDFLSPDEVSAGAVCMSAPDYSRIKTAIQQLCSVKRVKCTFEVIE